MNRARLVIFNAALGPLDYRVPEGMRVEPGSVVVAPLGPRQIVGIVWDAERLPANPVPDAKLRPLVDVLPVPPLRPALMRLIEWTADYYCASLASVARMVLASGGALRGPATTIEYRLTGGMPERMTPQRQAALEALEGEQATIRELAGIAGVSDQHHGSEHVALMVKTDGPDELHALVELHPGTYFRPQYYGAAGWIGIILNRPGLDWDQVADWLHRSWRAVAPARLTRLLDVADEF